MAGGYMSLTIPQEGRIERKADPALRASTVRWLLQALPVFTGKR